MSKHPRVLRLPRNELGRDFIVGDIHGSYDMVLQAMKQVGFDGAVDRLISVGDLVDRGIQSARSARFLAQSYVFAVKGNHEENLLRLYEHGDPHPDVLKYIVRAYHMDWWLNASKLDQLGILTAFARLPNVIEIETARGLVGIVHGDVPKGMSWPDFVSRIEAGDSQTLQVALEGRQRISPDGRNGAPGVPDESGVSGVGRVFVGHTIQRHGPARYGNVYAVDTGAVVNEISNKDGYALTFANVACCTMVLTGPRTGVLPKVITAPDSKNNVPFGAYAQNS